MFGLFRGFKLVHLNVALCGSASVLDHLYKRLEFLAIALDHVSDLIDGTKEGSQLTILFEYFGFSFANILEYPRHGLCSMRDVLIEGISEDEHPAHIGVFC